MLAERIDIAIRLGPPADYTYIGAKLFDERFVVCASQSYLDTKGCPRLPEEIVDHDCMHFPMVDYMQWSFHHRNRSTEIVKVRSKLRVTNSVILRDCAEAGMGVALLPQWSCWQELDSGKLVDLFPDYKVTISDFTTAAWLMYPSRDQLLLKVRVFVDFMKAQFNNWPDEYKLATKDIIE